MWPWHLTNDLENNRAALLGNTKLCASFHHHMWIQTGVAVRKRLNWVLTSVVLTFDIWPWPLICMDITSVGKTLLATSFNKYTDYSFHWCEYYYIFIISRSNIENTRQDGQSCDQTMNPQKTPHTGRAMGRLSEFLLFGEKISPNIVSTLYNDTLQTILLYNLNRCMSTENRELSQRQPRH